MKIIDKTSNTCIPLQESNNINIVDKINIIDKHKKYEYIYKNIESDIFWGLGIENEIYLEFENKIEVTEHFFLNNHKRERYSVNYYTNYKNEIINILFKEYLKKNKNIIKKIPLLLNSHSFLDTDNSNQSRKLYTKLCEDNPKFSGKTLLEIILENNEENTENELKKSYNIEWLFDGDTIEFTTINFYNSKLNYTIKELNFYKKKFITNIQNFQKKYKIFEKYGLIKFMENNHPFSIYMTNINNIGIFNNGTMHYNITLPTLLNNKKIVDYDNFINTHKKAIKIIQWFEPFLISIYNTSDPFYILKNNKINLDISKSSQRCIISRYIGIGTYDSDKMEKGKILYIPVSNFDNCRNWWYNKFHDKSVYVKLENLGLDINFNKHYNHGIELRIFDHIIDNKLLKESFEFIIYLMDSILDINDDNIINPIYNELWNDIVFKVIKDGEDAILTDNEIKFYEKILNIPESEHTNKDIKSIYYYIYFKLMKKYNNIIMLNDINSYKIVPIGKFSKLTLDTKIIKVDKLLNIFKIINIEINDIISPSAIIIDINLKKSFWICCN
jgi:hypothetical protein